MGAFAVTRAETMLPKSLPAISPRSVVFVPRRGAKQKWGGITRDPFKSLQKKLQRKVTERHTKIPLKSEERAIREMHYPLNITSLGNYYRHKYIVINLFPLGQMLSEYTPLEKFARAPLYTREVNCINLITLT